MTLEIITSDSLSPVHHGFFTRKGGASSGVFHGLNCGAGSSDQSDIVQINRDRVAKSMDVADHSLMFVHQIHSAEVVTVTNPMEPKAPALLTAAANAGVATPAIGACTKGNETPRLLRNVMRPPSDHRQ